MREPEQPEFPEQAAAEPFAEDDTPGRGDPYTAGQAAYRAGADFSDCPYVDGDPWKARWEEGFWAAEDEDCVKEIVHEIEQ